MRTNYTLNKQRITFAGEKHVNVRFKGGMTYSGPLSGLGEFTKEHNLSAVLECTTDEGRHGLYACLQATTEKVAVGMSVLSGCVITLNDGLTFATKEQMKPMLRSLRLAGIIVLPEMMKWGVTNEPFANARKTAAPRQMTLDEQMADSPFA